MTVSAIIVAAGSSTRMGFDKLAAPLAGTPVLQRTIAAFLTADSIQEIIVVCPPERWDLLDIAGSKSIRRVDGGATRQDSVTNGLAALSPGTTIAAIHDGARPLVHPADIDRCVAAAVNHPAVALARRVTETLKRSDDANFCLESVSRDQLWLMETPQVFGAALLQAAYQEVARQHLTVTDEVSAVQAVGGRVQFIESAHPNPKITCPADLRLAAAILTSS